MLRFPRDIDPYADAASTLRHRAVKGKFFSQNGLKLRKTANCYQKVREFTEAEGFLTAEPSQAKMI